MERLRLLLPACGHREDTQHRRGGSRREVSRTDGQDFRRGTPPQRHQGPDGDAQPEHLHVAPALLLFCRRHQPVPRTAAVHQLYQAAYGGRRARPGGVHRPDFPCHVHQRPGRARHIAQAVFHVPLRQRRVVREARARTRIKPPRPRADDKVRRLPMEGHQPRHLRLDDTGRGHARNARRIRNALHFRAQHHEANPPALHRRVV